MANFPPDISELIKLFTEANVEFILVGAHAVGLHGLPRYTKDFDFFVNNTAENAEKIINVLTQFIGPHSITLADLTHPCNVVVLGAEPLRVDLLTYHDGITFESAWKNATRMEYGGLPLVILSLDDLIAVKRKTDRPQDRADIARILELYPEKSVDP